MINNCVYCMHFSTILIESHQTLTYCEMSHCFSWDSWLFCTFSLRSRCHQSQVLRLWLCEFPQFLGKHRIVSFCTYSIKFLWNLYEFIFSMKTRSRCS